ncbi:acyl-CoA dehydrogenase [Rhodobacteraceae bacterium]|nr:acyl-CoA dehydrogenase [Paracoccaceae bacterium]
MSYRAPTLELRFILEQICDYGGLSRSDRFRDATADVLAPVLAEAGRICDTVLAPLNRAGDLHPARLDAGVLHSPPGFGAAYQQLAQGGWIAPGAGQAHGGMGGPLSLSLAVNDMMSGANLALQLKLLLSQGQIEALERHAPEWIRALYLPKLVSGAWSGTMNLTEPQAGSDLGALACRAMPDGEGRYTITGQKIYISWGESDLCENVCHLVLARLPGAPALSKGISLFLVPKYVPKPDGTCGAANAVRALSLERKMGLHGAPTCVMGFEGAQGWLIGAPNEGLPAMFTMMNNARLMVGAQGIGVAEAAFQQAWAFAQTREQGGGPIARHADVRRMLAHMRAELFAVRAIAYTCAMAHDRSRALYETGEEAATWQARAQFLTPIAKICGTELGMRVSEAAMQVHGGAGYIEDTGLSQLYRDVRVSAIYEGTNGIQALDLVGRKLRDGGKVALQLMAEVRADAQTAPTQLTAQADLVRRAAEAVTRAVEWLCQQPRTERAAGAMAFARAFGLVLGAQAHVRAARLDPDRCALAAIYIARLLPRHAACLAQMYAGAAGLYAPWDAKLDP